MVLKISELCSSLWSSCDAAQMRHYDHGYAVTSHSSQSTLTKAFRGKLVVPSQTIDTALAVSQ